VKYFKQPFSGKRTTSAYIPLVVKAIAEAKSINVDDVATSVLDSFQTFFGVRLN
jgi:Tat protein secretion system quality control protein TatD with DNase activity